MYNQQNCMNTYSNQEELADDLRELLYLANSKIDQLRQFFIFLSSCHDAVMPGTAHMIQGLTNDHIATYKKLAAEISTSLADKKISSELKRVYANKLRSLAGITGALLTSVDGQSPSALHSQFSEAGAQTGKITATINDYKRDHNIDAENYEHAFRSEYIDAALRIPPNVYTTSSGMAAFTTIVNTLHLDGLLSGPILVGESCYFECKKILEKFCENNIFYFDEMSADALLLKVQELQPSAIFLDTLCNTEAVAVPDTKTIITRLSKELQRPTVLVLDNTGLGISYQAFKDLPLLPSKLNLIVFESLIKYHQFGMDRTPAGIIWTKAISPFGVSGWRMHLGTTLSDSAVLSLPKPNRALLTKRMARMNRNAEYLASALDAHIKTLTKTPYSHVVYPGLSTYPGAAWTKNLPFHGSFFVLACKSNEPEISLHKTFVSVAIDEARRAKINLISGTSFGFDTTRIYLTALHATEVTKPFMRISVGTESWDEIQALAQVLIRAIDRASKQVVF
jgi:cystathionine beta-lyase/cystathionine gamma-synthase